MCTQTFHFFSLLSKTRQYTHKTSSFHQNAIIILTGSLYFVKNAKTLACLRLDSTLRYLLGRLPTDTRALPRRACCLALRVLGSRTAFALYVRLP